MAAGVGPWLVCASAHKHNLFYSAEGQSLHLTLFTKTAIEAAIEEVFTGTLGSCHWVFPCTWHLRSLAFLWLTDLWLCMWSGEVPPCKLREGKKPWGTVRCWGCIWDHVVAQSIQEAQRAKGSIHPAEHAQPSTSPCCVALLSHQHKCSTCASLTEILPQFQEFTRLHVKPCAKVQAWTESLYRRSETNPALPCLVMHCHFRDCSLWLSSTFPK